MSRALILILLVVFVACGEDTISTVYVTSEPATLEDWRAQLDIILFGNGSMGANAKNIRSVVDEEDAIIYSIRIGIWANRRDGVDSLTLQNYSTVISRRMIFRIDGVELNVGLDSQQADITHSRKLIKPMLRPGLRVEVNNDVTWTLTDEEITKMRAMIDFFEFWTGQ